MNTGVMPVPGDPTITFIDESYISAMAQFARLQSQMTAFQSSGQPVPTGLLHSVVDFLSCQEQRFSPGGEIATELASRGQLSPGALIWLKGRADDIAQLLDAYQEMLASNYSAIRARQDGFDETNKEARDPVKLLSTELPQIERDEDRMESHRQQWFNPEQG